METYSFQTRNGTQGIVITNACLNGKPVSRDQVCVKFSNQFDRKTEDWIEDVIHSVWEEKCQANNRLYNQSKFRFHGVQTNGNATVINLGLTNYRDLMGTNCHPVGQKLMTLGEDCFQNRHSYLSDALGIGSLLLTSDKKFVFLKRALWTGEDQGKLDRPGGHPEPENVPQLSSWKPEEYEKPENSLLVRNEVFDSVLNEIRDEVNVPIDTLSDPVLLGFTRCLERFGRPSAEFFVKCALSSKDIERLYSEGSHSEADESLGIIFLSEESVRQKELELSVWHSLTDSCCGAFELYSKCYSDCPSEIEHFQGRVSPSGLTI